MQGELFPLQKHSSKQTVCEKKRHKSLVINALLLFINLILECRGNTITSPTRVLHSLFQRVLLM